MYAIIKSGGKQYRVEANDVIAVEKLAGDAGSAVSFDEVLLVGSEDGTMVGTPTVAGASVNGEVVAQNRADKIIVFKKKRRKNYRRRNGHRQPQTLVKITDIAQPGA